MSLSPSMHACIERNKRVRARYKRLETNVFEKGKMCAFFLFLFLLSDRNFVTIVVGCYPTTAYVLGLIPNFRFSLSLVSHIAKFYISVIFLLFCYYVSGKLLCYYCLRLGFDSQFSHPVIAKFMLVSCFLHILEYTLYEFLNA